MSSVYRLAVISRAWWPDIRGGAEKFIHSVSLYLAKRGRFSVDMVTRVFNIPERNFIQEMTGLGISSVRLVKARRSPFLSSLIFSLEAAVKVNRIKPDAVLINGYWAESSPLYIDKNIGSAVIVHDIGFLGGPKIRGLRSVKDYARFQIIKRVVRRVDRIIVPSNAVKSDLVEFLKIDSGKIYVLGSLGVDGPFRYEHVENDTVDIVHIARFSPNKAQDLSIKAIETLVNKYRNIRLWLVGGRGVSREDLEYLENILRTTQRINKELGREVVKVMLDVKDVSEFYRLADICIAPSTWAEGYGLTVVECMAYGKPVIASDVFRETGAADEERAYIVRRGDPEALAQAIETVINNKQEAMEKAQKALEYVKRNCNWEAVAEKIENVLIDVIETKRKS